MHSSVTSKLINQFDNTYVESLAVSIKDMDTILYGVYRPPETPSNIWKEAVDHMNDVLNDTQSKNPWLVNILMSGDFNFPGVNWDERYMNEVITQSRSEKYLFNLMDEHFLDQTLNEATRVDNILDLILVNNPRQISHSVTIMNHLFSDHALIISHLSSPLTWNVEPEIEMEIYRYNLSNIDFGMCDHEDWFRYRYCLNKSVWSEEQLSLSYQDKMKTLCEWIVDAMSLTLPVRSLKGRKYKIPAVRKRLYRKKKTISNKMKRTRCRDALLKLTNDLQNVEAKISENIEAARFAEEGIAIGKIKEDPSFFYRYAKKFSKKQDTIGPLVKPDKSTTSNKAEMAELLASQYSSVFGEDEGDQVEDRDQVLGEDIPQLCDIQFTEEKIHKALGLMTSKPSPGPDGIPAPALKYGGDVMVQALIDIFTASIEEGLVVQDCRDGLINPTWKGGDKSLPENYRPIALTSHFSKAMEQIIRCEMIDFMDTYDLMDSMQHGSRKGRSTVSQLLEQHDAALRHMEDGGVADIVYLDFSKAFDRVSHSILLSKLRALGVRGRLLNWIRTWLKDRRQAVRVGGSISSWSRVSSSVPQGSILGPLMFLIFISDLGHDLPEESSTNVKKYVDDTKAMRGNKTEEDVILMQEDLDTMYTWESRNKMPFNGGKFMALRMSVDSTRSLTNDTLFFSPKYASPIPELEVVKDLGVLIDNDGTFRSQCLQAQKRTMDKCSWALRTFKSRDPGILKTLWTSLARPHQDYASLLWFPVGKTGDIAWQEKPLRMLSKKMKGMRRLNYWERLEGMKLLSCERRNERYKILYIMKILLGMVPDLGVSIQSEENCRIGLTLKIPPKSGSKDIVQTMKDQFFTTSGPRLFNSLPGSLRTRNVTFGVFKARLDLFLESVPDRPVLAGYVTNNYSLNGRQSNSLCDWLRNQPELQKWVPDITH